MIAINDMSILQIHTLKSSIFNHHIGYVTQKADEVQREVTAVDS